VESVSRVAPTIGEIAAGHVLGRYELLVPIGAGGMATVWAARLRGTRGFQKIFAIKTMLPKLSEESDFEQMFLDEASLASQIRHPHVVEILDLGEQDGVLYLVMEWIEGVPLNQLIKGARPHGGIPLPIAVRIAMQACAGLHAAHELKDRSGQLVGLVHRDVSPQNVLVTFDGVTKVVDFGIAKATVLGGASQNGKLKGKVSYMAPEQVKSEPIDRRIDVFAMGTLLYVLSTGKHPFRCENEAATMYKICAPQPVLPPRKILPGYPAELERVVQQALAKDPAKRFPTANDMLRALDQALPSSMRASTDEDVGSFVRGVLGEKREQSRRALHEALELADQSEHSRRSLRSVLETTAAEVRPSGVGSITDVTRTPLPTVDSLPPGRETTGSTAIDPARLRERRHRVLGAVAGALAFALAIALTWLSLRDDPARLPEIEASSAGAVPTGPPRVEPRPVLPPPAPRVEHSPLASSISTRLAEPSSSAPQRLGSRTRSPESRSQRPASSAATPQTKKTDWKQDPGF
jgi:serine/threonine-protein kinase